MPKENEPKLLSPEIPSQMSVQDELALFELIEKKEARAQRDAEKATFAAARKTVMAAQLLGWQQEEARRQSCPHTKPNNRSAIAGQRMQSNNYLWICQYCSKTWLNGALPSHLRIDSDAVGGPS